MNHAHDLPFYLLRFVCVRFSSKIRMQKWQQQQAVSMFMVAVNVKFGRETN